MGNAKFWGELLNDRGTIMDTDDTNIPTKTTRMHAKRETATRRAFYIWMAAYAAVIVTIALVHSITGIAPGITIDANGVRTQQAKIVGEPQSSIAGRILPQAVRADVEG
ncbi:hypothetical protein C3941_06505 [Kaistia algarum]|nr:hypothetical protein C3941_06505 [Kaistia algarum]